MGTEQSKASELKKLIQDDLDFSARSLVTINIWANAAPYIESRKSELETLRTILESFPDEVVEELAPALLQLHKDSFAQFQRYVPTLPDLDINRFDSNSTAGTTSTYTTIIMPYSRAHPTEEWARDAVRALERLAQEKAKKADLSSKLERLRPDLSASYQAALDSYDKTKPGIVGLDHAVMRMRDLIAHVWGVLGATTGLQCGSSAINNHPELRKPTHREKVANCLASDGNSSKLLLILDQLHTLHSDLSQPAKDPKFADIALADEFFTRLVFQLDSMFVWMHLQ